MECACRHPLGWSLPSIIAYARLCNVVFEVSASPMSNVVLGTLRSGAVHLYLGWGARAKSNVVR